MLDANLKSLVGILPILGAFIEFRDFRMVLVSLGITLEPQLEKGIEMEPDCNRNTGRTRFLCAYVKDQSIQEPILPYYGGALPIWGVKPPPISTHVHFAPRKS